MPQVVVAQAEAGQRGQGAAALSPATATALGASPSSPGTEATQRRAATVSSTDAGHGCSGASR